MQVGLGDTAEDRKKVVEHPAGAIELDEAVAKKGETMEAEAADVGMDELPISEPLGTDVLFQQGSEGLHPSHAIWRCRMLQIALLSLISRTLPTSFCPPMQVLMTVPFFKFLTLLC